MALMHVTVANCSQTDVFLSSGVALRCSQASSNQHSPAVPRDEIDMAKVSRRFNTIAVQSVVGGFGFLVWWLVYVIALDVDPVRALEVIIPYAIFFELGVLSRYVPGIKTAAKRLE